MRAKRLHGAHRSGLTAIALGIGALASAAHAQGTAERIEITGSLIKRLSDQTALPVSTITATEIQARGHVELKDFLLELPESSTIGFYAGTVGTLINLRGLGQARSLTLMNGRRFANEPLTDQYVSANSVPKIALGRVETLRDGASSSYGSDAIGGVQNFYTLRSFKGVKLEADLMQPERSGGGSTTGVAVLGGIGDLSSQGWNVYAGIEYSERKVLFRRDRPELSGLDANGLPNTALSPELIAMGMAGTTDLSATQTTPANFLATVGANGVPNGTVYNPYAAAGCSPPTSVRTNATARTCSTNIRYLDTGTYGNGTELQNFYAKGTLALGGDHQLSLEVNHSLNHILQYSNVLGITNNNYYLSIPKTSPWYPGGAGGVPVVVNGTTDVANASNPASPARLYVRWLPLDAGLPVLKDEHINDRIVLSAEGALFGFDYRAGVNWGHATRNTMRTQVYRTAALQSGLDSGVLNPFGFQNDAGMAYLNANQIHDDIRRKAQTWNQSIDLTLTKELATLAGGPLQGALGVEIRRNKWTADGYEANSMITVPGAVQAVNTTTYLGLVPTTWMENIPNSNQPDTTMFGAASRTVRSLFTEFDAPVSKTLTLNAALRADSYKYSHQTINAVNPKLSLRFQPSPQFMARASANTGFRAPALPEVFGNADEFRNVTIDDPLYCDSATGTSLNPGLTAAQVCDFATIEVPKSKSAGTSLKPEKSRAWTIGFGVQPTPDITFTADYWNTEVRDVLGVVTLQTLLDNYSQYAAQFIRRADGSIERVMNAKANVGSLRASGADVGMRVRFQLADLGTLSPGIDVSYTHKFDSKPVGSNTWISALATSEPLGITTQDGLTGNRAQIYRWKHTASLNWRFGAWSTTLSQRYQSKLRDRNEAARVNAAGSAGARDVSSYANYNINVAYTGVKNLKATIGVNNIFDVKPPLTNNSRYQGYLTQAADVLGRSLTLGAEYKF